MHVLCTYTVFPTHSWVIPRDITMWFAKWIIVQSRIEALYKFFFSFIVRECLAQLSSGPAWKRHFSRRAHIKWHTGQSCFPCILNHSKNERFLDHYACHVSLVKMAYPRVSQRWDLLQLFPRRGIARLGPVSQTSRFQPGSQRTPEWD